eukprot:2169578-Rhodomonas_salina.1
MHTHPTSMHICNKISTLHPEIKYEENVFLCKHAVLRDRIPALGLVCLQQETDPTLCPTIRCLQYDTGPTTLRNQTLETVFLCLAYTANSNPRNSISGTDCTENAGSCIRICSLSVPVIGLLCSAVIRTPASGCPAHVACFSIPRDLCMPCPALR